MSQAGFQHQLVVEWDHDACETIRANQRRNIEPVLHWPLVEGDVRSVDFASMEGKVEVISGGPPCQPFSLGGKHRGHEDARNMFPAVFQAVRGARPKAVLVENVKGLLRQSFASYFEYIVLQLTYPEIIRRGGEEWTNHIARLEQHHTSLKKEHGLTYNVVFRLLNAANYGVPQRRERVILVGIRSDLEAHWSFPDPTHSQLALLYDQFVSGEYWERHEVAKADRPEPPRKLVGRLDRFGSVLPLMDESPWLTVRDAIHDLPDPRPSMNGAAGCAVWANHVFNPGARAYPGHTGSPLDEPAKTLKAGDHGVPGGENMLAHPDGAVRYFTVREAARLQTFPDEYEFSGSWSEIMRQLGNAVPVRLAAVVASSLKQHLEEAERGRTRENPRAV
ncbi:MAG: DNA cytosine methyltransferase [Chthonomonas sp.]